jgi:hypothetical protein
MYLSPFRSVAVPTTDVTPPMWMCYGQCPPTPFPTPLPELADDRQRSRALSPDDGSVAEPRHSGCYALMAAGRERFREVRPRGLCRAATNRFGLAERRPRPGVVGESHGRSRTVRVLSVNACQSAPNPTKPDALQLPISYGPTGNLVAVALAIALITQRSLVKSTRNQTRPGRE